MNLSCFLLYWRHLPARLLYNDFFAFNHPMRKEFFFSYDSLTIYDGGLSSSPMMGKYCGDSIPSSHVSSSNEILVHFQSDGSVTSAGFKMEYNPTGTVMVILVGMSYF